MKQYRPRVGTVIKNTFHPLDLIEAFANELARFRLERDTRKVVRQTLKEIKNEENQTYDQVDDTLEWLVDKLNVYAPPCLYFGPHQGSSSDFGWWPDIDTLDMMVHDGEIRQTFEHRDVPTGYTGLVVRVNDHGNTTLYQYTRGRSREIWSAV